MKTISFVQLRDCVGVMTKEERVPSTKRIYENGTLPVIRGRFGGPESIRITRGGELLLELDGEANYEEIMTYPNGRWLAGNDMSVKRREIRIRKGVDLEYMFADEGSSL